VTGQDGHAVLEAPETCQGFGERAGIATREIDAAERAGEERVAAEQEPVIRGNEADRAFRMARRA